MIESIQFVLAFLKYILLKMVGVALLEYRRNLASLKQLYKLGKEKKSHPEYLFKISGIGSACCNPSDWGDGIRGWHEAGRPPK